MSRILPLCSLSFLVLLGCADGQQSATPQEKGVSAMQLTSTAFQDGGIIPKQCTADGKNISPALQWSGAPGVTKSFALICDDPDAPRGTWVHWVIFNLRADKHTLDEDLSPLESLPGGAKQGKNDFDKVGYGGPAPPPGKPHRYFFKLYALDTVLDLKEGATKQQLEQAMKGHILAQGELMGKYGR